MDPRETAGPVPPAESVFFSGPTSQFSAVDDCLRLGFAVYAKDDLWQCGHGFHWWKSVDGESQQTL